ncbi:zeta toxin family protein [Nocardiopsis sp. NRRL B-16309]|uniref:zeta toxin family protein n=1 Tax=Nocardiopsis sp. NRRL B-16309 TaxID=1519494 RepID=UPI0009E79AB4|nr:zeta toxin family protein [Nocardiopsis sp. NRRL B-16309]
MEVQERFKVKDEELREVFDDVIRESVFEGSKAAGGKPVIILLGGQLAAGKSTALKKIREQNPGIVEIDPDSFRSQHPKYKEIMTECPDKMVQATSQAMQEWARMCRDYAYCQGISVVVEGTFSGSQGPRSFAEKFAEPRDVEEGGEGVSHGGYKVEVVALATPEAQSRLDLVGRYLNSAPGKGRWNPTDAHDRIYKNIPETVSALEKSPSVHRVLVTNRQGDSLYENTRGLDGRLIGAARSAEALRLNRGDGEFPFGKREAEAWLASYSELSKKIVTRRELNSETAPSFLALHADADRMAAVAYAGQENQLAKHTWYQKVRKAVFMAGGRGVDNADLPSSPEGYFSATPAERTRYMEAMKAPKTVRRFAQSAVPPGVQGTITPSLDGGRRNRGPQEGPDLEL